MANAWLIWWLFLCATSLFNVAVWIASARIVGRHGAQMPTDDYAMRRQLLWLSAGYVLGCGFRSFLPMLDVPRLCLHDTFLSRIFIGRSVATIAELCFVAQWRLLLREAGAVTGDRLATLVSHTLVPIIVVAEVFSWGAVLTANYLLHTVENSLWTLAAASALAAFVSLRSRLDVGGRGFVAAAIICCLMYLAFMVSVDVPMWLARWRSDLAASQANLPPLEGLRTALQRCMVVREWAAWRKDVPWLSLYFTAAVWISIGLVHAPPLRRAAQPTRA